MRRGLSRVLSGPCTRPLEETLVVDIEAEAIGCIPSRNKYDLFLSLYFEIINILYILVLREIEQKTEIINNIYDISLKTEIFQEK